MKKLIDIQEDYLAQFRKIVSLQFPEQKITDKTLINMALFIAYDSVKKGKYTISIESIFKKD